MHTQVIHLVGQHVTPFPAKPVGALYALGTILLTAGVAALLHHLVEKPAQRHIAPVAHTRLPVPSLH